jgi:POT family proton-dependent oligopeptide transporter
MELRTSTASRRGHDNPAAHALAGPRFFGHPLGLGWLSGAEFCERFSYSGMQALLVLYMTHSLLLPGHVEKVRGFAALRALMEGAYGPLSPQALGSAVFGLYAGLVYLTPLAGGLLADRLLGRTKTVVLGASLMTAGHFLMAFNASFLIALLCLVSGVGCFKGNIASQLGALYTGEDPRRANAFQVFLLIAQLAGFFAPLICGTLGEVFGWHWGFGAAGVSMVIGLCAYLMGRPMFPPDVTPRKKRVEPRMPLTRDDWTRIIILIALLPILGLGMVSNQQFFNAYMIWSERTYDLTVSGHSIPVTWLQSLGTVSCTLTIILSVAFWRRWTATHKEPDEITKIALGTTLSAFAPLILALASYAHARTGAPLPLGWAVLPQVVNDLGFANVAPIAVALYSRAAPKRLTGLFIGIYYTHLFLANLMVGRLGGLLDVLNGVQFWLLHAAAMTLSALLLFALRAIGGKRLRDESFVGSENSPRSATMI